MKHVRNLNSLTLEFLLKAIACSTLKNLSVVLNFHTNFNFNMTLLHSFLGLSLSRSPVVIGCHHSYNYYMM